MKSIKEETTKLKEKISLDEKKKQNIYCIFMVLVLILLAFGDQIMLKFIDHQPNPNNTIFGENKEVAASDYKIEYFTELSISEVFEKLRNKEKFVLLSSRDSCHTCKTYIPILKEQFAINNIKGYYLNRSLYDRDNQDYIELLKVDQRMEKNLQYTPYIMYFKDGKLIDDLVGSKSKEEVNNFIIKNNIERGI